MTVAATIDVTPLMQALRARGHRQDFATQAAEAVGQLAAKKGPPYPGIFTVALGSGAYRFSVNVVEGKLVLLDMNRVV